MFVHIYNICVYVDISTTYKSTGHQTFTMLEQVIQYASKVKFKKSINLTRAIPQITVQPPEYGKINNKGLTMHCKSRINLK